MNLYLQGGSFHTHTSILAFSQEECDKLIKHCDNIEKQSGTVYEGEQTTKRDSEIAWVSPDENIELAWFYEKIKFLTLDVNSKFWNFDVEYIEPPQYTTYSSESNQHYGNHIDVQSRFDRQRKISFSLQLSSEDEYDGGNLVIDPGNPSIADKDKGTVIMFPSFILHRVEPVTRGIRKSMVWWVSGKPFK